MASVMASSQFLSDLTRSGFGPGLVCFDFGI